jgi:hypothetical protein
MAHAGVVEHHRSRRGSVCSRSTPPPRSSTGGPPGRQHHLRHGHRRRDGRRGAGHGDRRGFDRWEGPGPAASRSKDRDGSRPWRAAARCSVRKRMSCSTATTTSTCLRS